MKLVALRTVAVAFVLLVLALPGGARADGASGCGVSAPVSTRCTSGWHVYDERHDEQTIHAFFFTGFVESTLRHPLGDWIYSCSYVAGVEEQCDTFGSEPPKGAWVYHTCESYWFPNLEGGVGEYTCILG